MRLTTTCLLALGTARAAADLTDCIFGNADICNTFASIGKTVGDFAANAQRELASVNLNAIGADVGRVIQDTTADFHEAVNNINLEKVGKDAEQFVAKGVVGISTALSEFDIDNVATDVQNFFEGIGKDIQVAIMSVPWEDLAADAQRIFARVGGNIDATISAIKWEDLPRDVMHWIEKHPFQTIFYVANGIVFFAPGILTGPLLGSVGFTPMGPAPHSMAAAYQARFGPIVAGNAFATFQSAAMGGYGVAAANGLVRLFAAVAAGGVGILDALNDGEIEEANDSDYRVESKEEL